MMQMSRLCRYFIERNVQQSAIENASCSRKKGSKGGRLYKSLVAGLLFVTHLNFIGPVSAETENQLQVYGPQPAYKRSLSVIQAASSPVIDGNLDEAAWNIATVSDSFWISSQQRKPSENTEVLVFADNDKLYFGFRCYDAQPEEIIALQTTRDGSLGFDDHVTVQLDTFHNHRTISEYTINAIGTQSDAIAGGRARKIEWKGDWDAAVQRTDYGWSAEIAIPYSILNYRAGDSVFGVNFVRYQHRTREYSYWADTTPQGKNENMGELIGLALPEQAKKRPFSFMPFVLAGHNVPDRDGDPHTTLATAGLDIRYEPRPNVTGVLSLNPDFTQLERQVTDIDFSYTEKFREDPRPFFQEGSAYFNSGRQYFYSNRIPDFDVGAKLFTGAGPYQTGALLTKAPNERWDAVIRLSYEADATHSIDGMLVSSRRTDLDNDLGVIRIRGREASGVSYGADVAHTRTTNQSTSTGTSLQGTLKWQGDYWSIGGSLDGYDREYLPADGLYAEDVIGTDGASAYINYYRESGSGLFREVTGSITRTARDTKDGQTQRRNWYVGGSVETRQEIKAGLYYFEGDYRPLAGSQPGVFSNTVNNDYFWTATLDFNTRSSIYGLGVSYSWGELAGDDYSYPYLYAWARPTPRTVVNISTERLENFGTFEQTILSAGWDITNEQGIVARAIYADSDTSFRLAYRRQVREGMDIFAVYDNEPSEPVKVSVKLVWTIL